MHKSIVLIKLVLLLISPLAFAQAETEQIDPTLVSPDMYKVVLENEHVRVVEYEVLPGQTDNWHTHPAKVSYVISGGVLRITLANGESFVVEEKTGSTSWFGAVGKHNAKNVGDTPVHIIFVEIRQMESEQDDLDRYKNQGV